jgi:hypothetical protein
MPFILDIIIITIHLNFANWAKHIWEQSLKLLNMRFTQDKMVAISHKATSQFQTIS